MKLYRSNDGTEYCLSRDGFLYGDFDKAGKMSLLSLAQLISGGGAITWRPMIKKMVKMPCFVRLQAMEVFPEFYDVASVSSPWLLKMHMSHAGKTSFSRESVLYCQKSGVPLARNVMLLVAVDAKTRRPAKIPEELAKMVNPAKKTAPKRFYFPEALVKQDSLFSISVVAMPSETDENAHISYFATLEYCLNCASVAAIKGNIFRKFSKDMAYYNVKSFDVEYGVEMRHGDVVTVQCWEDPKNACILYFIIKVGEKTACRCVGEWHSNDQGQPVELHNKLRFLEQSVSRL